MSNASANDLSSFSMLELFRADAETQLSLLTQGLLVLERDPAAADQLRACMRAAHSLKGAARIIGLTVAENLAHGLEDCLVAAQKGRLRLGRQQVDALLAGVDLLTRIATLKEEELPRWETEHKQRVGQLLGALAQLLAGGPEADTSVAPPLTGSAPQAAPQAPPPAPLPGVEPAQPPAAEPPAAAPAARLAESHERFIRVSAGNLNRLLGLAGESLVESRWLRPYAESLLRLKRQQAELAASLASLRESLGRGGMDEATDKHLGEVLGRSAECRQALAGRLAELESFGQRATDLSQRLYREALASRMRPFGDGTQGFARLVRDLARALGKEVRLELAGETTEVDRDILDKLESPLTHLLRNAVDHGIEPPAARLAAGKPAEGLVRLEARHSAGMLLIIVADDGCGVDLDTLRQRVVDRQLTTKEVAAAMTDAELLEFLFLPGFSLRDRVSPVSGRGVGLDVVQTMVKQVRGAIRVTATPGRGMRFQLQLPLTLSVLRALLVEVAGEPYAFPLAHLARAVRVPKTAIESLEGRQHAAVDGRRIGLVTAHQILDRGEFKAQGEEVPVVVLGSSENTYGLVVDRFLGERELVVQPLDPRLGKVKDISAAALMADGAPVLIVDVGDMLVSIENLVSGGRLAGVRRAGLELAAKKHKRILVADDSLTVRELERKLLAARGYEVETAVDGTDAWNAARMRPFDLVVTDVDMPRLDGIELVSLLKKDPRLRSLPVMIVSYKERPEDRQRGLAAGADYYLAKGSFHDETLLRAVLDLIGEASA